MQVIHIQLLLWGRSILSGSYWRILGDMYGYKLKRAPDGQVIYDPATGLPARPSDIEYVGNAFPEWRAGLQNEFKIKTSA